MTITICGNDIHDARNKLGMGKPRASISINWRSGSPDFDYGRIHEVGCIVDATDIPGEEVKQCFTTSAAAVRYIAGLLKKHDAYAREQKKKRAKEERERIKKAAK